MARSACMREGLAQCVKAAKSAIEHKTVGHSKASSEFDKDAESEFLLAHRLYKAKMDRWARAEDRKNKGKPCAHKQIEKYYKNQLELERARAQRLAVLC